MKDENKTKEQLIDELGELHQQLAELKASEAEHRRIEERLFWEASVNEAIADLSSALIFPKPIEDISFVVLEHAKRLTSSEFGYVSYIDPQTGYHIASTLTRDIWDICQVENKDIVFKKFTGLWGWVLNNRKPLMTNDPSNDPRSSGTPQGHVPIHRFLSVPACIGETLVGQIALANSDRDYTDRDIALIERLAALYAVAIQRKRSEEMLQQARDELEKRVKERTAELVKANEQMRREIEERKRADEALRRVNRALKTLSNCNQALVHATDESELIAEICRIIVEIGGYRLAWVGFAEQDKKKTVRPVGQWGYEEGYLATVNITWAETERGRGPTGTAIRNCKPSVVRHIQTDPDYEPWRAEATKRGYASSIALPLLAAEKSFGALNIYAAEPDAFDKEEVFFLNELAENLSYGIMMLRLRAERKRADEELRKSEMKYSILVESSLTGIYIEQSGKIAFANDRFAKIYGYSKDELTGIEAWRLIHPKDRPLINEITAKRLRGEKAPSEYEARGLTKDGKTIWVTRRNTLIEYKGSSAVLGNIVDISKRKRMEKALRESEKELRLLSSQLLTAQENERKRIARELHDGIGQSLSAIKFSVESTLRQMDKSMTKGSVGSLKTLIPLIQEAIEEVRKIAMDLRPSTLDDLGILATISWFCREFQTIYSGIRIEKQITIQENEVPDPLKTIIYRVFQEALNNVAKHSEADLVRISLRKRDTTIELAIEDNGLGFDLEDLSSGESFKRGLGLASMRERTEVSGGAFAIESIKGTGTIVRATWKQ